MNFRRIAASALIVSLPMSFMMHKVGAEEVPPGTITTVNVPEPGCHEEDPCWDCETMGNLTCGVEIIDAVSVTRPEPRVAQPQYNG